MRKILAIALKDLFTTFTDRGLVLIMVLTPVAVATIIGLAFGGGGGDSDSLSIRDIPVVVVNLDQGSSFLPDDLPSAAFSSDVISGTVADLAAGAGLTETQGISTTAAALGAQSINYGDLVVEILTGESGTDQPADTDVQADTGALLDTTTLPPCPLAVNGQEEPPGVTLAELFAVTPMADPTGAREAVASGDYAAAIIIPAGFSAALAPDLFDFATGETEELVTAGDDTPVESAAPISPDALEVYTNPGAVITGGIVRAVVEGIVGQFVRSNVTLEALADSMGSALAASLEVSFTGLEAEPAADLLDRIPPVDAPLADWERFLTDAAHLSPWFAALANLVTRVGEAQAGQDSAALDALGGALACIFDPDANTLDVVQEPLNALQERDLFSRIMVQVGSAQAVFFALFTGAFGMLAVYDERRQGTLQRMLVSPTRRSEILGGLVVGNVVVVWVQLLILMAAMTVVASLITGRPNFIWGSNIPLLLALTGVLALCVSGLGVFLVGIARTPEQVRVVSPMINMTMGALGGAFGFAVPAALANLSLITWGVNAFNQLAAGETDIGLNLAVLGALGLAFFSIGLLLFRRRVEL